MDEDFRNPMARQAGAGVQHEIGPGWSLGADLLVVDTIHLQRNRDLNVPPPTVRPDDPRSARSSACGAERRGRCRRSTA